MPDASGIELCAYLRDNYPGTRVVALTGFKEFLYVDGMMRNGAKGYLLKNSLPDEIVEAIRCVHAGEEYFTDEANAVISSRREGGRLYLTTRERELLTLIAEGYTNREISEKLFLSVETVNGYRKTLLLKLGVKNTAAMVRLAITEKLV